MAEKAQIDFTIDGAPAAKTLGELETKAEQLNAALKNAELGSDEYKKLNQQLIQTSKQVKNLELGFESLDNEKIASEIGSVAGAVGDITSAMVLLGGENENIEKMAANIQTALGVSMAFKGSIEGFSSAFKLFNNVVKASPIFLWITVITAIGSAIAGLIVYWDEFVGALVKGRDMVVGVLNSVIEFFTGTEDAIVTTSMAEQRAHEKRMAQQKEIADAHRERLRQINEEQTAKLAAADETIKALTLEKETLEAQGKSSDEATEKILEAEKAKTIAVLEGNTARINSWTQYYKDLAAFEGMSEAQFIESMKKRGIDLESFQQKADALLLENERAVQSAENRITEFKRKQGEERQAEAERLAELEKERLQEEADAAQRAFELEQELRSRQLMAEELFNQKLLAEKEQQYLDETLALEAQIDRENALKEQQAQADQERRNRNQQSAMELFTAAEGLQQLLHDRELKRANEKTARGEDLTKKEITRLKRQEVVNKAFALAQIAKDTAQGVIAAVKAGAGIPFPGNLFAIGAGIAAVIAGATQAAGILGEAVEIPTADVNQPPGGGDLQDLNTNTPVVNPIQAGSTFLNQEPQKVYVVESDISVAQDKVKAIVAEATFN